MRVLALALAARLAVVLSSPDYRPFGDPADYDRHALFLQYLGRYPPTSLASPGGASAIRPPGYPYFLALIYELTGKHFTAARLAGALLGVATVLCIWLIAHHLWGPRVALWAGAIAAVFPPLFFLSGSLLAENLFLPSMLGAVYCALRVRGGAGRHALWWALASGLLLGLAVSARGNGIFLLVPLAVAAATFRPRPTLRSVRFSLVIVGVTAATLVPWTIRDEAVFGRFLPFGTQDGYTLAGTYNSDASHADQFQAVWRNPEGTSDYGGLFHRPGIDEGALDATLRHRALSFAVHHPNYVLTAFGLNTLRIFDVSHNPEVGLAYREENVSRDARRWLRLALYVVVGLAIVGVLLSARQARRWPAWLVAVPLLMLLSVAGELSSPRYRAPVDPFLVMLAAITVASVHDRIAAARAAAGRSETPVSLGAA